MKLIALIFAALTATAQPAFLLHGGTVHTISGGVIEHGDVLIRDGRIIGVGSGLTAPEGVPTIDVTGQQVYPGMVDCASLGRRPPEAIGMARRNGVTGVVALPRGPLLSFNFEPGAPIPVHLQFPAIATRPLRPHESEENDEEPATAVTHPAIPYGAAKRERDRQLKQLNELFASARRYAKKHARPDPKLDALLPILNGSTRLVVTAVREREIREAIQFADHEKLRITLADAAECYKVIPEIVAHGIPVLLEPTYTLPLDDDDDYDRPFVTPGELARSGVQFCIGTFSSNGTRNLPYQAGAAVPFGLSHDDAYRAVSLNPARMFGLKTGSIEEGKAADLIVTDGDPLEATTKVTREWIAGTPVDVSLRKVER